MKHMKLKFCLLAALLVLAAVVFASCGDDTIKTVKKDGFTYKVEDDGEYTLLKTKCDKKQDQSCPKRIEVPAEVDGHPVTGIWHAFRDCGAEEVVLPDTITYINDSFVECHNLKTLDLPDSLWMISGDSFDGCSRLVAVENGFSYVDNWVVASNPGIVLATLREGTVGVKNGVSLMGLLNDGNITLPDSLCYLGDDVFEDAVIPGTVTINELKFNDFCFYEAKVGKIVIKGKVQRPSYLLYKATVGELEISGKSLCDWPQHQSALAADKITITDGAINTSEPVPLETPALVIGEAVTSICASAFKCSTLKSLTVEGSTTIAEGAFSQCGGALEELKGPATLLAGMDAASLKSLSLVSGHVTATMLPVATQLKSLTLAAGVTVAENAFAGATALETVTAPLAALGGLPKEKIKELVLLDGTAIAAEAFVGFAALESITIPKTVTTFGADAFLDCTALKNVYYGGTLLEWATLSFAGGTANPLSHAETLYINGAVVTEATGLTALAPYAFYGYRGLTKVTFAESLTRIPTAAFAGCTALAELSLPTAIFELGANAFADCTALTSVTFPRVEGWVRYESADAQMGNTILSHYLNAPDRAAAYLTDTYAAYIWRYMA